MCWSWSGEMVLSDVDTVTTSSPAVVLEAVSEALFSTLASLDSVVSLAVTEDSSDLDTETSEVDSGATETVSVFVDSSNGVAIRKKSEISIL